MTRYFNLQRVAYAVNEYNFVDNNMRPGPRPLADIGPTYYEIQSAFTCYVPDIVENPYPNRSPMHKAIHLTSLYDGK